MSLRKIALSEALATQSAPTMSEAIATQENDVPSQATQVFDRKNTLAGIVGATAGRLNGLQGALMLAPTNPGKMLRDPNFAEAQRVFEEMRAKHPDALKNTVVQVGGHDLKESFKRTWNNKNIAPGLRHLAAATEPIIGGISAWNRADHYNPWSDTVTVYSQSPEILRHEIGHAIDFNNKRVAMEGKGRVAKALAGLAPAAYMGASIALPGGTLLTEAQATRHALNSVKGDPEREAETWKMLAPAYGSYAGGAAAALREYGLNKGWFSEGLLRRRPDKLHEMGMQIGIPLAGVAAGHGVAALRNAIASRRARKSGEADKKKKD